MLAEKVGLKHVVRTPIKSVLFLILMTALAALFSLGVCVFSSVNGYLNDCDSFYNSIAELEYVGASYPDNDVYDEELVKALASNAEFFKSLVNKKAVKAFYSKETALGLVESLERPDQLVHDMNESVILVKIMSWDELSHAYTGIIEQKYYSWEDCEKKMVFITEEEGTLEKGCKYIFSGKFFPGKSSYLWFRPLEDEVCVRGETVTVPKYEKYEDETSLHDEWYKELASVLYTRNNSFRVLPCEEMDSVKVWQQGEITLVEGRSFEEEEYSAQEKACIVPQRLLNISDYKLGDTINISINYYADGAYSHLSSEISPYEGFKVIGVYKDTEDCPDTIFIPKAKGSDEIVPQTGYTIGTFKLDNDLAEEFVLEANRNIPDKFRIVLYDEGYGIVASPYKELRKLTILFLSACLLVIMSVLSLYSYLFISRKQENAKLMLALGSGKRHVFRSFYTESLVISCPGMLVGGYISSRLQERVVTLLSSFVEEYRKGDYRYSSTRIYAQKTLEFTPTATVSVYLAAGVIFLLLGFVFTILFVMSAVKERKPIRKRKKKTGPKSAGRSSHLSGPLKYMVLSIRRGGIRTFTVIILCMVMTVFLGQLSSSKDKYREQLENIKETTIINGYSTDYRAKSLSNLVITAELIQNFYDKGIVDDICLTSTFSHGKFLGVIREENGTMHEILEYEVPENGFARETLRNRLSEEPSWIQTNSLVRSPYFYYEKEPMVTWYRDYNELCLDGDDPAICVLPVSMMDREGIELGDVIRVLAYFDWWGGNVMFYETELYVVGCYEVTYGGEVIYSPLAMNFPIGTERCKSPERDLQLLNEYPGEYDTEWDDRVLRNYTISGLTFTLKDPDKLDLLREALSESPFSEVGKTGAVRNYAVIDDADYLSTMQSMQRQIKYMDAIYTGLYVLAMIIGFVAAYLLLNSRKSETALMRAIGTPSWEIIANQWCEQFTLSLAGCALGIVSMLLLKINYNSLFIKLIVIYEICWLVGSLIKIVKSFFAKTQELLSEQE